MRIKGGRTSKLSWWCFMGWEKRRSKAKQENINVNYLYKHWDHCKSGNPVLLAVSPVAILSMYSEQEFHKCTWDKTNLAITSCQSCVAFIRQLLCPWDPPWLSTWPKSWYLFSPVTSQKNIIPFPITLPSVTILLTWSCQGQLWAGCLHFLDFSFLNSKQGLPIAIPQRLWYEYNNQCI